MKRRRDPVTPEVAAFVRQRDGGCVGGWLGMPGLCTWHIELDHIDGGGLSRRGPSTPANLVSLCSMHHRNKTEHASTWRPMLREWTRIHAASLAPSNPPDPPDLNPYPEADPYVELDPYKEAR